MITYIALYAPWFARDSVDALREGSSPNTTNHAAAHNRASVERQSVPIASSNITDDVDTHRGGANDRNYAQYPGDRRNWRPESHCSYGKSTNNHGPSGT